MKQWTYTRIDSMWGKDRSGLFFNCPCLIVYAENITAADKQFNALSNAKIAQLYHISVKFMDVTHVGVAA